VHHSRALVCLLLNLLSRSHRHHHHHHPRSPSTTTYTHANFISVAGQVDLWTRKSVGCACSWKDSGEHDHAKHDNLTLHNGHHKHGHQLNCACCVKGGCQCGEQAPNRCSQCGLENHCLNSKSMAGRPQHSHANRYLFHPLQCAM
jgi:hypothetical protein